MADKIPVRARLSGSDVIALQEFEPTDTIPLSRISGFASGVTSELGNNSIGTLGDVSVPTPANNEVLTFNSVSGNWEASISPGSSAAIWGNITGTLSNQLDLQAALDLKANDIDLTNHVNDVNNPHLTTINNLNDVILTATNNLDLLQFNGTSWVNVASTSVGVTDHTALSNIGTNTHAQIDTHIADGTIHYSDAPNDAQDYVRNNNAWIVATQAAFGEYQGPFDASAGSFPVTTNSGDWFNVTVAGTVDGEIFAVGDILMALVANPSTITYAGNWTTIPNVSVTDHTLLTNIGTNTHAQIDTHIADGTVHFTQANISITESQISDLQSYLTDITNETIGDLIDVTVPGPTNGQVLTFSSGSWIASSPAGGIWGTITGTLSDQLDLQSALDTKVETASNIGTGNGVFAQKVAQDLEFKTLVAGENIQIASTGTEVAISSRKDKFFAHNGPVTQTFGTTLITVLFPTVIRTDPSYTYINGEVTINTAGWYFIEYQISIGNTGNTRASSETGVTVNSLTVFEPGSLGYAYHRNTSSGRATFSGRILVQLAVNDIIRIRTHKDGAGTTLETLPDACRLTIVTTGAP